MLAALAVFGFAVLPAEHIHVARVHDRHHSDVVHRHFEPHHRVLSLAIVEQDDDDDHDVQWLTPSFTNPNTTQPVSPANQLVEPAPSIPAPAATLRRTVQPLFVSVHDPPWTTPSGLRAPPAILI